MMSLNPYKNMEKNPVVNGEPTTPQPSEGTNQSPVIEEGLTPVPPGSKTDPALLLKSLQEEKEKRRLQDEENKRLLEEIEVLKTSTPPIPEAFSDEGKLLESKILGLTKDLSEVRGELAKKDVLISHPVLKDKWEEFEEFRSNPENKGMNMRTAAKAFLVENGLFEPERKGLEKTTGGSRAPTASGMTAEQIKNLRTTNFKKYQEMLKNGQIKVE